MLFSTPLFVSETYKPPAMEIQKELPVDLLTESSDYIQRVIDTGDCDEFIFKTQKDLNIFGMLMNRIGKFGDCITKLNVNGDIEYKYEPTCNFRTVNDIVLDKITGIEIIDPVLYPRVYDLTVPSTINFGLANGLHVVDTALSILVVDFLSVRNYGPYFILMDSAIVLHSATSFSSYRRHFLSIISYV
jgi:hypothetical protein